MTTASGSRHLLDTSAPDDAPQVCRLAAAQSEPGSRFLAGGPWFDEMTGERHSGLRVGKDAILTLNLRGDGAATIRRTTPVVLIEPIEQGRLAELGQES
ncbi:hypothetical protein [Xylanimonas ulmi]|uniref:hypothetical protein n=1 Tax=Xylanimonas ulmi TaxID=228973 RepID=UPI00102B104E|nr:hypothetical protein [Xylanibacterium ulmi]